MGCCKTHWVRASLWVVAGVGALACALAVGACATGTIYESDAGGNDVFVPPPNDAGGGDSKPPPQDGAPTCTPPEVHCFGTEAGACSDLTKDPNHCGTCGTACSTADGGGLEAGTGNPDAGIPPIDGGGIDAGTGPWWSLGTAGCTNSTCDITCPSNMTLCSDSVCYDTQNFHDRCGDCNTACQATEYCAFGHCCASGTLWCGSSCVDVLSDKNNCGKCGNVCGANLSCNGGKCTSCSNTNLAPTATATISGGGSVAPYLPSDANDNVLETGNCNAWAWITAGNTPGTDWIQYTWSSAHTFTSMHMDTLSGTTTNACNAIGRTLGAATVQWWNGSSWVTDGQVTGQLNDWNYTFTTPVTTSQVRLYAVYCTNTQGQTSNPVVFEWQVFGCN